MSKKIPTPEAPARIVKAPKPKPPKPSGIEVDAPSISSEEAGTIVPSKMLGTWLTVDTRLDSSDITVEVRAKEAPELVFENIVDSSGQSGARNIKIPLVYLTTLMGFTALFSYKGRVQGQEANSLVKEVGVSFYEEAESKEFAPKLLHGEIINNTPTYRMASHKGDETVLLTVHSLAKEGDRYYINLAGDQHRTPYAFYIVTGGHTLSAEEAVPGYVLSFKVKRGWLGRRWPWGAVTLHCGVITSGLPAKAPDEVDPHLQTFLPGNALEIPYRRTYALVVDPYLEGLPPPHLRQSVLYEEEWCLNPGLTKHGGDVDVLGLETYTGDQICFYVGGPGHEKKLLGCVTIKNDGDPVTIELSACDIACFFSMSMTLSYTVQFPSSGEAQQSPEQVVNVLLPQFTHPGIEDATGHILDLGTFTEDATAFVPAWDYVECAKCCWMWITGKREDGSAIRIDILMDALVTDDWKANGVYTPIPRIELQKLADCGDFKLHFAASYCEAYELENAHEFLAKTFNLAQEALVVPHTTVLEAVGSNLTVYNGKDGVTVRVKYPLISNKHQISVCWKRSDGTCLPLASKPGDSGLGHTDFDIPREAVIHGIGKTVTINYTVTSACKVQTSDDQDLVVSEPVRLPTPVIPQATPPATNGGILDLATFAANASVTVVPWWFILVGQRVWLRAIGTKATGGVHTINVYLGKIVSAGEVSAGLADILKRADLDLLLDGSNLTVTCKVTPDGDPNESSAVVFPSLTVVIRKPLDDYTTFSGNNWNNWRAGAAANGEMKSDVVFGRPCVSNGTLSVAYPGAVLYKDFTGLQVDRTYQFSIEACTYNGARPYPILSLSTNAGDVTASTTFSSMSWRLLSGSFVATTSTMRLYVNSWVSEGAASGMDYAITNIRVKG